MTCRVRISSREPLRVTVGGGALETLVLSRNPCLGAGGVSALLGGGYPKLKRLYLDGCALDALPADFGARALPRLELLDLRDNRLTALPPAIASFERSPLASLALDANPLRKPPLVAIRGGDARAQLGSIARYFASLEAGRQSSTRSSWR